MGRREMRSKLLQLDIPARTKSTLVQSLKGCNLLDEVNIILTPFQSEIKEFLEKLRSGPQLTLSEFKRKRDKPQTETNRKNEVAFKQYVNAKEMHAFSSNSIFVILSMIFTGNASKTADYLIASLFHLSLNRVAYCCQDFFTDLKEQKITTYTLSLCSDLLYRKIVYARLHPITRIAHVNISTPNVNLSSDKILNSKPIYLGSAYESNKMNTIILLFSDSEIRFSYCSVSIVNGKTLSECLTVCEKESEISFKQVVAGPLSDEKDGSAIIQEHPKIVHDILKAFKLISHILIPNQSAANNSKGKQLKLPEEVGELGNFFNPVMQASQFSSISVFFCNVLLGHEDFYCSKAIHIILRAQNSENNTEMQFMHELACIVKHFNIPVNVYRRHRNKISLSYTRMNANKKWKINRTYLLERELHFFVDNEKLMFIAPTKSTSAISSFQNKLEPTSIIANKPREEFSMLSKTEKLQLIYAGRQHGIKGSIISSSHFIPSSQLESIIGDQNIDMVKLLLNIELDLVVNDLKMSQGVAKGIVCKHFYEYRHQLYEILEAFKSAEMKTNVYSLPRDKQINSDFISVLCKLGLEDRFMSVNPSEHDSVLSLVCNAFGLERSIGVVLRLLVLYEFLTNFEMYSTHFISTALKEKGVAMVDVMYHLMKLVHTPDQHATFGRALPIFYVLSNILNCEIVCIDCNTNCELDVQSFSVHSQKERKMFILSIVNHYHLLVEKKHMSEISFQNITRNFINDGSLTSTICQIDDCENLKLDCQPNLLDGRREKRNRRAMHNDETQVTKKNFIDALDLVCKTGYNLEDKCKTPEYMYSNRYSPSHSPQPSPIEIIEMQRNMDDDNAHVIGEQGTSWDMFTENDEHRQVDELIDMLVDIDENIEETSGENIVNHDEILNIETMDMSYSISQETHGFQLSTIVSTDQNAERKVSGGTDPIEDVAIPIPKLVLVTPSHIAQTNMIDPTPNDKEDVKQGKIPPPNSRSRKIEGKNRNVCDDCHVAFETSKKLNKHFNQVHLGVIARCLFCCTYWPSLKSRFKHMLKEHAEELTEVWNNEEDPTTVN